MAKFLLCDEVKSIVEETKARVVLEAEQICNLQNDINVALSRMGPFTLERINLKQAEKALSDFKQDLRKIISKSHIIKPLLPSLTFQQSMRVHSDYPLIGPRIIFDASEMFFGFGDVLLSIVNASERNDVKNGLPIHAKPNELILSDLPKIYRAYFNQKCGSGDGPGSRFIVAVLNQAGIKNQRGKKFEIEGVIKFRERFKPSENQVDGLNTTVESGSGFPCGSRRA